MIPAVPNPVAQAEDGSDAEIPAANGVEYAEALLAEAFPGGFQPPPPPSPLNAEVQQGMAGAAMQQPMAQPGVTGQQDYTALLAQVPPEVLLAYATGLQQPAPGQVDPAMGPV